MRLGTCIAVEVAVAVGAIGGLVVGVARATDVAGTYLSSREAAAATSVEPGDQRVRAVEPLPAAELRVPAPQLAAWTETAFPGPDEGLLAPLAATPVTGAKLNHGGTSLSLRIEFASGARAAFKPQQNHLQSDPRREIAAYRVDRLLKIGHVPPAKAAAISVEDLVNATEPTFRAYAAGRLADEAIAHGGMLRGELSWWIPEIRDMTFAGHRVDEAAGMDAWTQYLHPGVVIPPDLRPIVSQLASCVLFDVLIDNSDRWTGNNTKSSPDRKTLYFMDNTLAFSIYTWGHAANLDPLRRIEVFPRGLVTRLRAMTLADLQAALDMHGEDAGLGPLLDINEERALLQRRDHLVAYIDALIAQYGEDAVLALP